MNTCEVCGVKGSNKYEKSESWDVGCGLVYANKSCIKWAKELRTMLCSKCWCWASHIYKEYKYTNLMNQVKEKKV